MCCPTCRIFSWRFSSDRYHFRKTLGSSLRRDNSPITLSPFITGADTDDAARKFHRTHSCFTFIRVRRACCCSVRPASYLNYFFISPEFFPVPSSIIHSTMLCSTLPCTCTCTHTYPCRSLPSLSNVLYQLKFYESYASNLVPKPF
jgi:hypothetical protein